VICFERESKFSMMEDQIDLWVLEMNLWWLQNLSMQEALLIFELLSLLWFRKKRKRLRRWNFDNKKNSNKWWSMKSNYKRLEKTMRKRLSSRKKEKWFKDESKNKSRKNQIWEKRKTRKENEENRNNKMRSTNDEL